MEYCMSDLLHFQEEKRFANLEIQARSQIYIF